MIDPTSDTPVLVTGNEDKWIEAERILGLPLRRVSLVLPEIQAHGVEEVTRSKLDVARAGGYGRVIVEDVSLGFDALGNFPGPYVKWLLEAAGGEGLGAIARGLSDRSALAQCCVAYWDGAKTAIFLGETAGEILLEPRGGRNFGWDAWFRPRESPRTYGEMDAGEKDLVSHRGKAYRLLRDYLQR